MRHPVIRRLVHLYQVLIQCVGWVLALAIFALATATLTFRDAIFSAGIRQALQFLPDWSWGWWMLVVAVPAILIVLEGSYRVRRRLEGRIDELHEDVRRLSAERAA